MKFKDYYQILGVTDSASQDEIKRAYRKKARQYHPDVSTESDAEEQFKSVNEAYEALKDEDRRAEYDQLKKHGFRGGDDFRPPPGWQGGRNTNRSGHGQGGFGHSDFGTGGDFSDFFESIFRRGGFGQGGFESDRQSPFGSQAGQSRGRHSQGDDIRLNVRVSLENAFRGGKTKITVPAAPGYPAKTLSVNIPVTPAEMIEGTTLKVPTLSGAVSLKIPPSTKSGKRLRIKGRGLPAKPAGDQRSHCLQILMHRL